MTQEMNLEHLKSEFFDKSEMLLSIYDKNLTLLDVNPAFLTALRFEKADIVGKNINDFSPDCKTSGRYAIYENVIKTGTTFVTDQIKLHPSLGNIYLRLTAFKVGEGLGISSKDITDLKETIDDLETFIYRTSHDVRAPIATSLGLIDVARNELKDNQVALNYLGFIEKETQKLDTILTKLLETTKIRQGEKIVHRIDFEDKIQTVIQSLRNMEGFSEVLIKIHVDVKQKFLSDRRMLFSLFHNLMHNAIKYRSRQVTQPIILIEIRDEKEGVLIKLSDNGIGIPAEQQQNVYRMFFRASTIAEGSGLGLYTVKHCIKKLNGRIHLESNEGKGTQFTIYLPNSKC